MRRKKILILPTLRDRKGDISKKWYVEVSQRNPSTDEMVRKRFEVYNDININSLCSTEEAPVIPFLLQRSCFPSACQLAPPLTEQPA